MIYEVTISCLAEDESGKERKRDNKYLINEISTFAEAETVAANEYGELKGFDVPTIKRSNIREIANGRTTDDEKIFIAQLADVFVTDEGVRKETMYYIALHAADIDAAHVFIKEYLQQGYDLELRGLKESKFAGIIEVVAIV